MSVDAVTDRLRSDIDRIELLAAVLAAFNEPVPNYEPRFQHLRRFTNKARELTSE
jgi:hypothetical protein